MLHATLKDDSRQQNMVKLVGKGWSWLLLLVLLLFFSITGQGFLSLSNLQTLLTDMAFVLLLALGQTCVIISGGIDLSTGSVMGLASVVSAQVVIALGTRLPLPVVALIGMGVGVLVGLTIGVLNGMLITRLAVPPFLVTLGMSAIARGTGFLLASGQPVSIATPGIGDLGGNALLYLLPGGGVSFFRVPAGLTPAQLRSVIGLLPLQLLVCMVLVVVCFWLLAHTRFGVHTYAIGGNQEAARRAGIPVARRLIQLSTLSAVCAAIAGVLYMLRYSSGTASAGDPLLIDSIAAAAIGGASLFGGTGTIMGTLVGTLIIAVLQNGLVILGMDPFWQYIAIGAVMILAVFLDQAKAKLIAM